MHDESDMPEDDAHEDAREDRGLALVLGALAAAPRPRLGGALRAQLPAALQNAIQSEEPASQLGSPPALGDLVDERYRIEGVLGEGGMGIVFSATHLTTQRRVALKWLRFDRSYRSGSEQDARLERFAREARSAGRIRHPNVIDVFDAGTSTTGPFLVMEHLEGEPLRARIDRAAFSWDEALQVLLPVMAGVSEAHRCGVVHRDLKPDNVVLAKQTDGSVRAKVLDFGISRLSSPDGLEEHASLTKTGAILGTPAYMALEQLRAGGDPDARTDIYALGVMLYEMLSQHRPYVARNAADYAALIACERPTPLSRYRADLKGAREQVLMKALERSPKDRYQSVAAFAQALSCAQSGRQVTTYLIYAAAVATALIALALGIGPAWAPVADVGLGPQSSPTAADAASVVATRATAELEVPEAPAQSPAAKAAVTVSATQSLRNRVRADDPAEVPRPERATPKRETHTPQVQTTRALALTASDFSRPGASLTPSVAGESSAENAKAPPLVLDRTHF